MPWKSFKERLNRKKGMQLSEDQLKLSNNQVNFATCFISPSDQKRKMFPCDPDLLLHGLDIAKRKRNLFVSAETLSRVDAEVVDMLSSCVSLFFCYFCIYLILKHCLVRILTLHVFHYSNDSFIMSSICTQFSYHNGMKS